MMPPLTAATTDVRPVCHPEMPPEFREWALGQRPTFDSRGRLAVITPGGSSRGAQPTAIACWLLAAACMILLFVDPPSIGGAGWLAAAAAAAIAAGTIQRRSSRRDLRLCRTKVIFPDNLDATCRALLSRTQRAVGTIARSNVRTAGLLAKPVQDDVLGQHEWEIAGELRDITKLRSLHAENTRVCPAGPMTTDVLTAHERAIELAQEASIARVAALERYAEQITAADKADRDWQRAVELSKLNDRYLDLVARAASDQHATSEIARLTEQLAAATQARHDRLQEADLAAEVLALPGAPVQQPRQAGTT
jgi:hypothetical protein